MSQQAETPRLECGRDLLAIVEQVADGLPPKDPEHQSVCAYCQEAIARLRLAFDSLRELAGQAVRAPRGLSARELEQLRRERHSGVISAADGGRDTVSEVIVSQIARQAVLALDAVRHASVVSDSQQAGGVQIDVHITARLGPPLPDLIAQLREQVMAHVWTLAGARVTRVDVPVDDLAVDDGG
jgi:uncharacterized alkaline shock family protein YloU